MEIKSLEHTPLSEIVACFNHAFSDYFVPIAASEAYMEKRWSGNRVDYSLSFGAFEKDQLVAFIIHGIDVLHGRKTAYNSGTGVIPEFRGQQLISKLYAYALPRLKAAGITQSTLEVISQNEKALKAYKKVGFTVTRNLPCFRGTISATETVGIPAKNYQLSRNSDFDLARLKPLQAFDFSWENQDAALTILKSDLESWEVSEAGELKGYLIFNKGNGALLQFGFSEGETLTAGSWLLTKLVETFPTVRINHVDSQATELIQLFKNAGLENHLDQYEMLLSF